VGLLRRGGRISPKKKREAFYRNITNNTMALPKITVYEAIEPQAINIIDTFNIITPCYNEFCYFFYKYGIHLSEQKANHTLKRITIRNNTSFNQSHNTHKKDKSHKNNHCDSKEKAAIVQHIRCSKYPSSENGFLIQTVNSSLYLLVIRLC
jgi:hypothetical protein